MCRFAVHIGKIWKYIQHLEQYIAVIICHLLNGIFRCIVSPVGQMTESVKGLSGFLDERFPLIHIHLKSLTGSRSVFQVIQFEIEETEKNRGKIAG